MRRLKMLILAALVATNVSLPARGNDDQLTGNWGGSERVNNNETAGLRD